MAINTLIMIVIGVLVLIALIYLVGSEFGMFSGNLKNLQGGDVDSVVGICNSLVDSQAVYNYCCEKKVMNINGEKINFSCNEMRDKDFVSGRIKKIDCNTNCSLS